MSNDGVSMINEAITDSGISKEGKKMPKKMGVVGKGKSGQKLFSKLLLLEYL